MAAIESLLLGETGWLIGFLSGMAVGIGLCRWLYINGHRRYLQLYAEERLHHELPADTDGDRPT